MAFVPHQPVDLADVTERLMGEFEGRLGLAEISRVVRECSRDLAGPAGGAATSVLEQCARERLAAVARPVLA